MNDRKLELARKKELLEMMKRRKEAAAPAPVERSPLLDKSFNVDDFLADVTNVGSRRGRETKEDSKSEEPKSPAAVPEPKVIPTRSVETYGRCTQTRQIILYGKETQTEISSSDESEDEAMEPAKTECPEPEIIDRPDVVRQFANQATQVDEEPPGGEFREKNIFYEEKDSDQTLTLQRELFAEKWTDGRVVMDMDFAPHAPELIVISYALPQLMKRAEHPGVVEVWNVALRKSTPEHTLFSPSPVMTTKFCVDYPEFLVGGCYNGQIVVWDLRNTKRSPEFKSPISAKTHTSPVHCLHVTGHKTVATLVSVDAEGQFCMWKLSNIQMPLSSSKLRPDFFEPGKNDHYANVQVRAMAMMHDEGNTYVIGCEDGDVAKVGDSIGPDDISTKPLFGHGSRVNSIDCHPARLGYEAISDLVLSTSLDYTIKISNARTKKVLFQLSEHNDDVLDAKWHPVRPSVFASLDVNGWIYVWDMNDSLVTPISMVQIQDMAKKLLWSPNGKKLLVGDGSGKVHVFSVHKRISELRITDWKALHDLVSHSS